MKAAFSSYYDLTGEQRERLWNEAVVVLDTNVLLDLYRVPEGTRGKILDMLRGWKDRLWIPHQVGVEFHGKRQQTISTAHLDSQRTIDRIRANFVKFRESVDAMELQDRGHPEVKDLLGDAAKIEAAIIEKAHGALAGQISPGSQDHILEDLDELLEGKVGPGPSDQKELDDIFKAGSARYAAKMGPGFEDAAKATGDRPKFMVGGLVYETQYSDLLLWKQILKHAKSSGIDTVLFVTKDVKRDWWQIVGDRDRIAPLPELRAEMAREGDVDLFWMYTLDEAIQMYGKRGGVEVSQAIEDVKRLDPLVESGSDEFTEILGTPPLILTNSRDRLQQAAEVMNLYTVTMGREVASGYSLFNKDLGAVLIPADLLGPRMAWLADKIRHQAHDLKHHADVNEVYLVIVVPPRASLDEVRKFEEAGLQMLQFVGAKFVDKLMLGTTHSGIFEKVESGKVDYTPFK